ncbi:MAG: nucleotidyl transferase AbiEii/AbiGii toxin family protein [Solirubrobacterales bacterium]|nr:nucleotidyl transferase AbiEii/AbiGii toxin family protein [Solirubrobacterales bacterium]
MTSTPGGRTEPLSAGLRAALAPGTAEVWQTLAPHLPGTLYLGGGTAVAVHLRHRWSADLDFFYHGSSVDLDALSNQLSDLGTFAATRHAPGTLRGLFAGIKVEFLHADQVRPQILLREPTRIAGLRVAALEDLMAMKLKVIGDRGEARDYFDVMSIDERGVVTLEDGIALFLERYGLSPSSDALPHLIAALGYLDDVEQDDALPLDLDALVRWWQQRQARLVRELGRWG